MNVEIILTGTELLLGEIVDTNSVMMAKLFRDIGLNVFYKTTVGDNEKRITDVIRHALQRVDVVIVSGGLGPTVDDVTRQAIAVAIDRKLVYRKDLEEQIEARFKQFGRQMAENNKRQAWIPTGATPLSNPVGTAPSFIVETTQGTVICLPGVPKELEYQLKHTVIPYLKEKMGHAQIIKAKILHTCGIGESDIDRVIDDLMRLSNPTVGLAAHIGQTDIRITAKASTEVEADELIMPVEMTIRDRLTDAIFGVDQETLATVIGFWLQQHGLSLSLIDTFTQGSLSNKLIEASFADLIAEQKLFKTVSEAIAKLSVSTSNKVISNKVTSNKKTLAKMLAEMITTSNKLGVTIIGPTETSETENSLNKDKLLIVAISKLAADSPSSNSLSNQTVVKSYPFYYGRYDLETYQQWLAVQVLDLIRRHFIKRRV